ncbi:MAG: DUF4394 domain-containing protein [Vulcanimicrobiota bacterium]
MTVGLAALMTFGCGNVISSTTGRDNDSQVQFLPNQPAANPDKIWAIDTDGKFFFFFSDNPTGISAKITPTGLPVGEKLIAIDCRPRTGFLYGISTLGKVFWIDKATGVCRQVAVGASPGQINADIDFNPVVDRIRQEAGNQNARINPNNGTVIADALLTINGQVANAVGCAYTNPIGDTATSTQLFVVTGATNRVYRQGNPNPNDGVLIEVGQLPLDTASNVGFDISPANVGYIASQKLSDNFSNLLRFDPAGGGSAIISAIAGTPVKSIAVDLPGPAVTHFAGIDSSNRLVKFDSSDPTVLLSSTLITGLVAGDTIVGCDFAPGGDAATGLKVLAVNGTAGRIYSVNLDTAVAGAPVAVNPALVDPTTFTYGVDVDAAGNMHITAATGTFSALGIVSAQSTQNWTVSTTTGAGGNNTNLVYPSTDRVANGNARNTFVPAIGFTNNFQGAGFQPLRGVDVASSSSLPFNEFIGITPGPGTVASIGEMGLFMTKTGELEVDPANNIWLCAQRVVAGTGTYVSDNFSTLYRVSPNTGASVTVSRIGGGTLKHFTSIPTLNANLTTAP